MNLFNEDEKKDSDSTFHVLGIHHVAIIASDYAASRDFYMRALGAVLLAENFREERKSWKGDLKLPDGAQLELFSFPGAPARPSYPEAQGLRHLALAVKDLDRAVQHLRGLGIAVEQIRVDPYTGSRFTFFADPDDLPIEFYEVKMEVVVV